MTATIISIPIVVVSIAIAVAVLVSLPVDYLQRNRAGTRGPRGESSSVAWKVARNVLGALLVVVGVVFAIPGVPGPGLIVALAGLLLLDFPGKRRALSSLLSRPRLLHAINGLRRLFSQPALDAADPRARNADNSRS